MRIAKTPLARFAGGDISRRSWIRWVRLLPERHPELDIRVRSPISRVAYIAAESAPTSCTSPTSTGADGFRSAWKIRRRRPTACPFSIGILRAELLEEVLHGRYPGTKRYSLEGATALIPLLDEILEAASESGGEELMLGMSHRGRLNVMVHIVGKSPADIFAGFEDVDPRSTLGGGDVKYHIGAAGEYRCGTAARFRSSSCQIPATWRRWIRSLSAVRVRDRIARVYGGQSACVAAPHPWRRGVRGAGSLG